VQLHRLFLLKRGINFSLGTRLTLTCVPLWQRGWLRVTFSANFSQGCSRRTPEAPWALKSSYSVSVRRSTRESPETLCVPFFPSSKRNQNRTSGAFATTRRIPACFMYRRSVALHNGCNHSALSALVATCAFGKRCSPYFAWARS